MREQTTYNKLVGRKGDHYYFCDAIFSYGNSFKGATGTILVPISKDEYDERMSDSNIESYLEDDWYNAVAAKQTTLGLEDWIEFVRDSDGDENIVFPEIIDDSRSEVLRELGLTEEDFPVIECSGGGRCFHADDEFDEVYDAELLQKIREAEKSDATVTSV